MDQPCPQCGYVSDRPARFCRQCGTPLFTESEASQAATRNYAPPQTPQTGPSNYGHQPAPPHYTPYQYLQNDTGEQAPETTRFYQPPVATEYPAPPAPTPKRSRARMILLIALICCLVIGGGITFLIVSTVRRVSNDWSPADRIERGVRQRVEDEVARAMEQVAREAEREAERASRNAPPAPPAPPFPPGALPASLEPYKYPGAEIEQATSALGSDIVKMTTSDTIDKVIAHYRQQLGNPIVQNRNAEGQNVIFQTSGAPSIIVMINPDQHGQDKIAISIVRSRIQLPNLNQLNR